MVAFVFFFFSSRRRHTRCSRDWSSDVCSSDLGRGRRVAFLEHDVHAVLPALRLVARGDAGAVGAVLVDDGDLQDRKSTRLNSSHGYISYAVFCLKKKNSTNHARKFM